VSSKSGVEDGGAPVIVISMALVVVGFVTLMLGVLGVGEEPLLYVYLSIGACLVAALFLVIGVVRGRPSKKPVVASGGDRAEASWAGASAWSDVGDTGSTAVLQREESTDGSSSGGGVQIVTAAEAAGDARTRGDTDFAPPSASGDASRAEDAVVVVPARSEETVEPAPDDEGAQETTPAAEEVEVEVVTAPEVRKATAGKATAKKATASKATAKKATASKATAKKATASKATAKKATAKKATASKATAKKATASPSAGTRRAAPKKDVAARLAAKRASAQAGRDDAARIEQALGNVSGVGPAKRTDLLRHFGSFDALASATVSALQEVDGISATLAERIRRALR
jgi:chemotaxis protein histidine kinase CheA